MHDQLPQIPNAEQAIVARFLDLTKNTQYAAYAQGEGPLRFEEVSVNPEAVDELTRVKDKYDWPTDADGVIEPVHDYDSAEAFTEALREGGDWYLNNLNAMFKTVPTDKFVFSRIYGVRPALQRANVIAPELFEAIRELYATFSTSHDELTSYIKSKPMIADQLNRAFHILGRLIKVGDLDFEIKQIDPSASAPDITSAQTYLTT